MITAPRGTQASDDLDMVRGIAALGVFVGHARSLFFVDYPSLPRPNAFHQIMYFAGGLGHQWVMVFFVLSGFFISGSILREMSRRRWSWPKYLTYRGVRLYVVLLPSLLLTLAWDRLGMALVPGAALYEGGGEHLLQAGVRETTGFGIFAGNLAHLQTVFVPTLGSNGPLWSLSNEWWYYMLFPCLCLLVVGWCGMPRKLACLAAVAVIAWFGRSLLPLFPIWLLGSLLVVLPQCTALRQPLVRRAAILIDAIAFLGSLYIARRYPQWGLPTDYAVGITFAIGMYIVLHRTKPARKSIYGWIAGRLAGMSYTVYLTHLPLLVFICASMKLKHRWYPDAWHVAIVAGIVAIDLLYCYALSRVAEARTDRIRNRLLSFFPQATMPQPQPAMGGVE